jgi:NAD-dependent dihydropyrimidine dehydrogenase PreA subunit|uniref:Ferredoxin, 4Fe-4S, putative n=1 Tax=Chlorobium chlorochromatii (strain CaD3) TaxID=340177 RepID=Q3ATN2_CHLCH
MSSATTNTSNSTNTPRKRKRLLAPREEIPWFPTLDLLVCNGCADCIVYCKPGVFELDEKKGVKRPKVKITNPFKCLVLCTRCVPICTSGAIKLPNPKDFEHFVEEYEE